MWCQAASVPPFNLSKYQVTKVENQSQGVPIGQCFFQHRWTQSWIGCNGQQNVNSWQKCSVITNSRELNRTDFSTNLSTIITPLAVQMNDPFISFQSGFHSNGSDLISINSGNSNPLTGYIGFNVTLKDMCDSHWVGPGF